MSNRDNKLIYEMYLENFEVGEGTINEDLYMALDPYSEDPDTMGDAQWEKGGYADPEIERILMPTEYTQEVGKTFLHPMRVWKQVEVKSIDRIPQWAHDQAKVPYKKHVRFNSSTYELALPKGTKVERAPQLAPLYRANWDTPWRLHSRYILDDGRQYPALIINPDEEKQHDGLGQVDGILGLWYEDGEDIPVADQYVEPMSQVDFATQVARGI